MKKISDGKSLEVRPERGLAEIALLLPDLLFRWEGSKEKAGGARLCRLFGAKRIRGRRRSGDAAVLTLSELLFQVVNARASARKSFICKEEPVELHVRLDALAGEF